MTTAISLLMAIQYVVLSVQLTPNQFIKNWQVLGPIPYEQPVDEALQRDYLSPHTTESSVKPKPGNKQKIDSNDFQWNSLESKGDIIDLTRRLGNQDNVVGYAFTILESDERREVLMGLGSDDGVRVWVNGELAHHKQVGRPLQKDSDLFVLTLNKGENRVLVKVQNQSGLWGFSLRELADEVLHQQLVDAAARGDLADLQRLLDRGTDVNATAEHGLTALHAARLTGQQEAIDVLLSNGADPDLPAPNPAMLVKAKLHDGFEGDTSGVAVLVARDGRVLLRAGFGMADLDNRTPITPQTRFLIGSITKQFTACAVLKLVEDGRLKLDDTLDKYVTVNGIFR